MSSTVSRPLVTNHCALGSASGLLTSMRPLSQYWTSRLPDPSGASAYASSPATPGAGPQIHERLTLWAATALSVRVQSKSKLESAKLKLGAAAGALMPFAAPATAGNSPLTSAAPMSAPRKSRVPRTGPETAGKRDSCMGSPLLAGDPAGELRGSRTVGPLYRKFSNLSNIATWPAGPGGLRPGDG